MQLASNPFPGILTVHEHESVDITERGSATTLSVAEVEALEKIAATGVEFFRRFHRSVKFSHYGGLVAMDRRVLEILPKIDAWGSETADRATMLRMLRVARVLPAFSADGASHDLRHVHLLEAFVEAFFDSIFELSRGGLLRQYLTDEDDLHVVRGRIALKRQFATNWNRSDRIACRFDELTVDNNWNRVLKLATAIVRPWISSSVLFRRWVELNVLFDDVSLVSASDVLSYRLAFDRQAVRYRTAIGWAMAIICLFAPSLRGGRWVAPALLYNLNHLFEAAVAAHIEQRLLPGDQLLAQSQMMRFGRIVDSPDHVFVKLKPDLVLRRGGSVVAIGDTKWKMPAATSGYIEPSQDDIYQMFAYAAGFRCSDITLIYPWQSKLSGAKTSVVELPETQGFQPRLHMLCVDVSTHPFRLIFGMRDAGFGPFIEPSMEPAAVSA